MNALVGGQVDYMCGDVPTSVSQLRARTIQAYAVGGATRNPMLPDVPTSKEAGLPEFQASGWTALFAPKSTPKPILDKLAVAVDKALDDATTRKRLLELGSDIPDKASRGPQSSPHWSKARSPSGRRSLTRPTSRWSEAPATQ
jgi:tripartite-type tricarboxylate transporter receptor subunit TctC